MNTKTFKFNSTIDVIGAMPDFPQDIIKNEPMFFNASPAYAYEHGGPITKTFVCKIADRFNMFDFWADMVLDTRVHMAMEGFYLCIPGFHHDDVPRNTTSGQPNYYNPDYHSKHIMGLVNGDIAPTQFAVGKCEMPDIEEGEVYYRKWHPIVENLCETGELKRYDALGNPIIAFEAHSFHRGQQAIKAGWRWFGRVSYDTDRTKSITNEIRNQVQVYIPAPDYRGW